MTQKANISQSLFFNLGILILIGFVLIIGQSILIPLAFSLVISMLLYPLMKWFVKKRMKKGLAIIFCLLALVLGISLVGIFFVNGLQNFASDLPILVKKAESYFVQIQQQITHLLGFDESSQMQWIQENAGSILQKSQGTISSVISSTSNFLSNLTLIPLYIFFILFYANRFKIFCFKLFTRQDHQKLDLILTDIRKVTIQYITGLFKVIILISFLNFVGLLITGIDHPFFFAISAAILTLIPFIGVAIGAILPIAYSLFMYDDPMTAVYVTIVFILVQFLEGNIISPKIIGGEVSLNPLMAILALMVGAAIWGIAGMVLFVPFLAILKAIMDHIDHLKPYGYLLGDSDK